ncbi:helix-turn-helix transcriptional regulator, partial [Nocardia gipuzkoensis]
SEAVRNGDGTVLPAEVLMAQIRSYIRRHATDCNLTPGSIARAHCISVRRLYQLCSSSNFSLQQAIIQERLQQARHALIEPRFQRQNIAMVANMCGFRDPSHFSRRFRAAFGMTPREWQSMARAGGVCR